MNSIINNVSSVEHNPVLASENHRNICGVSSFLVRQENIFAYFFIESESCEGSVNVSASVDMLYWVDSDQTTIFLVNEGFEGLIC